MICKECHKKYISKKQDSKFCSNNCRFENKKIKLTAFGKTQSQQAWTKELDLGANTIRNRRKKGLPIELCLSKDLVITDSDRQGRQKRAKLLGVFNAGKSKCQWPGAINATLSTEQLEFLNGNLLGDASLRKIRHLNSNLSFTQKLDKKEYAELLVKRYMPFTPLKISEKQTKCPGVLNGKINHSSWDGRWLYSCYFESIQHQVFTELRHKWYPNGKKAIPRDLKLTWKTFSTWYCDDGCNVLKDKDQSITLYTNGFSIQEVKFLINCLNRDLKIKSRFEIKRTKEPMIRIHDSKQIKNIFENIKLYIPQCFAYKLIFRVPSIRSFRSDITNPHGYNGISQHGQKWVAKVGHKYLGRFYTKDEAIKCRKDWEIANPNIPAKLINILDSKNETYP